MKISRRSVLQAIGAVGAFAADNASAARSISNERARAGASLQMGSPILRDPIWVYDIWSVHTNGLGGPDDKLDEELAMRQVKVLKRLKGLDVRFDYYMMNFGWYDADGAYRKWRRNDWPNGPDRWIAACLEQGIKPGLWFGTNTVWKMNIPEQWRDSLAMKQESGWPPFDAFSCFEGGFLRDFIDALQYWYDRGIRMFEFDNANFDAGTEAAWKTLPQDEIRERNEIAFSDALKDFRTRNPDAALVAFNGFHGRDVTPNQQQREYQSTLPTSRAKHFVDLRWLEVFDTIYSGDVRVSDVPQGNFWRSVDIYCDHMVRRYEKSLVPLERTDSFCTFSTTSFGYHRGTAAWKGMLLLTAARGSWKNTVYGSLDLLDDADAHWFSKVQSLCGRMQALGRTKSFGGMPGDPDVYGYGSFNSDGALYTVVNPTQECRTVTLPRLSASLPSLTQGRVLFTDAGFTPTLRDADLTIGCGQMVVIGFGDYANSSYDLGIQHDVVIPKQVAPVDAVFTRRQNDTIETTILTPAKADLRIVFFQRAADGLPLRTAPGKIEVRQDGKLLPIHDDLHDKVGLKYSFFGISWSLAEIRRASFAPTEPITITCTAAEMPATLEGRVYAVQY